jgi:hypothetical protein
MSTSSRRVLVQELSTDVVQSSSVSLLVAKTQFTLAVQIAIEALMNKCGYSRERATTTLLKELNRSSNNNNNNNNTKIKTNTYYVAGSGSGCGTASANLNNVNSINNIPTDDEVRIVYGWVPILDNFSLSHLISPPLLLIFNILDF